MKTNHQKPSVTLIKRKQRRQTIHLVLGGAFKNSHPDLTKCFYNVNLQCPSLLRYLTVPGTRLDRKQDANLDTKRLVDDPAHIESAAIKRLHQDSRRLRSDQFLSTIWPHQLPTLHPFRSALRDAYKSDYGMPNMQILDKFAIQWAGSFCFLNP
jgi:hypothetical protein